MNHPEDWKQLIRSSGSVTAICLEANESPGVRDRLYRMKISRKEAKESELWLKSFCELSTSSRDNSVSFS
ncbi:four helix bundle protein [Robertkochia flava]|uniref:four helix bundle protein n=1 Tax=Robertkochia flava TaxID=3447986 RepID=UPI00293D93AF|nr:four helix bundle protein [Robertkochia marina]